MKLKDIRFVDVRKNEFFKDVLKNSHNKKMKNILMSRDSVLIETVLSFFKRNKNNSEPIKNELQRLEDELELRKIIDGDDSESYRNMLDLKQTLSILYRYSDQDFKDFRSNFVEYVCFLYFAISTPFVKNKCNKKRRFFHEPRIFFKSNNELENTIIKTNDIDNENLIGGGNNLVDLVHVNKESSIVDVCECKADLNHFLLYLKQSQLNDHNCIKSLKKWTYMCSVQKFFNDNVEDCESNLYFFTFADTVNNAEKVNGNATIITSTRICKAFCNY